MATHCRRTRIRALATRMANARASIGTAAHAVRIAHDHAAMLPALRWNSFAAAVTMWAGFVSRLKATVTLRRASAARRIVARGFIRNSREIRSRDGTGANRM
jgi:hypothetical protein